MKRRTFIALLGGAAAWPLPLRAQPKEYPPVETTGFLTLTSGAAMLSWLGLACTYGMGANPAPLATAILIARRSSYCSFVT